MLTTAIFPHWLRSKTARGAVLLASAPPPLRLLTVRLLTVRLLTVRLLTVRLLTVRLLTVPVIAVGIAASGCVTAPPCRCTCESCNPGVDPLPPPEVAAPYAAGSATPVAAGSDAGNRRPRSVSRAGETLTEAQLLARYEGKRAVDVLNGKATYYANSLAGRKTASGEPYEPAVFSAAHRTLPFGTVVRVVRTDTNKYVYVRITDRGPFAGGGRIIDLSYVAAERLGMIRAGVVPVRIEVLK